MVFSLLLNISYIYIMLLSGLLKQYSLAKWLRAMGTDFKSIVKIFSKKFHRYLAHIFVWLDKANQWLEIYPILFSLDTQACNILSVLKNSQISQENIFVWVAFE